MRPTRTPTPAPASSPASSAASTALTVAPALLDVVNAVRAISVERARTERTALACQAVAHEATMVRDALVRILDTSHDEVVSIVQQLPMLDAALQRELVALLREAFTLRERNMQMVAGNSGRVAGLLSGRTSPP